MKKKFRFCFSIALALCMVFAMFAACAGKTITLSESNASIIIGESITLTADVSDGSEVTWSTSDFMVATVSRNGVVTGNKAGTATITATSGDVSATCDITVSAVTVSLSQPSATLERWDTLQLSATASDNGKVTWYSDNSTVASVDENGLVTANKEGTAIITAERGRAGSDSCTVTVVWSTKPDDYYDIQFGEEANHPFENNDTFFVWNDQGWGGSNVILTDAYFAEGKVVVEYSGNTVLWYGLQLFYQSSVCKVGTIYRMTCKINSCVDSYVRVCGQNVWVNEGDNEIEVYFTQTESQTSFSFQPGYPDEEGNAHPIESGKFIISELQFSVPEPLDTPTAVSFDDEFAVTVTDTNGDNVQAYVFDLYDGDTLAYRQTVEKGGKLNAAVIEDGTYGVKVQAKGGYRVSAYSDVLTTITIANGGAKYDLPTGVGNDAIAQPGVYVYYSSSDGITQAKYENRTVSIEIANSGESEFWANQLFFEPLNLVSGTEYKMTFNLYSSVDGKITVNGLLRDIVVGENEITVKFTKSGSTPALSITFGADGVGAIAEADIAISNVSLALAETVYGEAVAAQIGTEFSFGDAGAATGEAGTIFYWNDQGWCGSTVAVKEASSENNVITINYEKTDGYNWFGLQLFYKNANNIAGVKYKLTCTINSTVTGKITLNGKEIELIVGDNLIEVEYTESAGTASFSLSAGSQTDNTMLEAATFVITNLCYAADIG